jgi:hypothetical protein
MPVPFFLSKPVKRREKQYEQKQDVSHTPASCFYFFKPLSMLENFVATRPAGGQRDRAASTRQKESSRKGSGCRPCLFKNCRSTSTGSILLFVIASR